MTTTALHQFPEAHAAVEHLVQEHRKENDEPVLLALYYAPARDPDDIFLFEIFDGFGHDAIDDQHKLFEVKYSNREGFPLGPGQVLHMLMTNAPEFERAVRDNWPHIEELREAVRQGHFQVIYAAPAYADIRSKLGV